MYLNTTAFLVILHLANSSGAIALNAQQPPHWCESYIFLKNSSVYRKLDLIRLKLPFVDFSLEAGKCRYDSPTNLAIDRVMRRFKIWKWIKKGLRLTLDGMRTAMRSSWSTVVDPNRGLEMAGGGTVPSSFPNSSFVYLITLNYIVIYATKHQI